MLVKLNTVVFVYLLFILGAAFTTSQGQSDEKNLSSTENQNNTNFKIRLGGLFTMYSRSLNENCDESSPIPVSIENSEMVFYTIDEINRNPNILPGVELDFQVMADCWTDTIALNEILQFITGNVNCRSGNRTRNFKDNDRYWGLIGPETSAVAVPIAKLLGLFSFPQISCGATSSALSDKQRFPSFFRTVPSDTHQIRAIIDLLLYNGWHYVSFIHEDDEYGNSAFDAFNTQIRNTSICTAQVHKIGRNVDEHEIAEVVRKLTEETRARVVIGFVFETRIRSLFHEIFRQNHTTTFQWIGSDIWSNLIFKNCSTEFSKENDSNVLPPVLDGTIFFQLHSSPHEDFEQYLKRRTIGQAKINNLNFAKYIAYKNKCSLEGNNSCSDNLTLPQSSSISSSPLRLSSCPNTALAYAYALDDARKNLCDNQGICEEFMNMNRSLLKDFLRNVSFNDRNSFTFQFDSAQDGPVRYNILRYDARTGCWDNVGEYSERNGLNFTNKEAAGGRGDVTSKCSNDCAENQFTVLYEAQRCCWQCRDCPSNSGVLSSYVPSTSGTVQNACHNCSDLETLVSDSETCESLPPKFLSFDDPLSWPVAIASSLGITLTLFAGMVYIWFWDTPLIRASGRELSSLIMIGIFLIFAVSFLFCVQPTNIICGARRFGIGFSFSLVFSGLLVKTIRISIVFNDLGKRMVRDYKLILRPTPQVVIALLLTGIEVIILIGWLLNRYPMVNEAVTQLDSNNPEQVRYRIIDCQGMKSSEFLVGLCYPILLFLVCAFYAIKIRKVPAGFNEAKFIGFAVYTTLVIWLAQLSTYFVQITEEIELRDAIYCMCLSLNALIILLALFGPKVYIALLRPEKNNQSTVMASQRHPSTPQISTMTGNKFFEINDANLVNSQRSRTASIQIQPNFYPEGKHCSCCVLRQRNNSIQPFEKSKKESNITNAQTSENSINLNIVDKLKYTDPITLNNNEDNAKPDGFLTPEIASHFRGYENQAFENSLKPEKI